MAIAVVLCVRADQVPAGRPVPPGVKSHPCAGCGARCLLAPSSRKLVERGHAEPRCGRCLPAGQPLVVAWTAEGQKELEAYRTAELRN
jgi:hypothetical protein